LILDSASRNAGTREEGEPGSQCGSRQALLRVPTMLFSLLREADCTFWVFLQTHKTAMVGNVLTPWGVIASFDRVYTSSSAPQCERNVPPGGHFLRSTSPTSVQSGPIPRFADVARRRKRRLGGLATVSLRSFPPNGSALRQEPTPHPPRNFSFSVLKLTDCDNQRGLNQAPSPNCPTSGAELYCRTRKTPKIRFIFL